MYTFFLAITRNYPKGNLSWLYLWRDAVRKGERSQSLCISEGILSDIDLTPTSPSTPIIGHWSKQFDLTSLGKGDDY